MVAGADEATRQSRRAERERVTEDMGMPKAMRQMPELSGRVGVAHGEAVGDLISDEACGPPNEHPGTGSARPKAEAGTLLEAALTRENLQAAWKHSWGSAEQPGFQFLQRDA